MLDYLADELKRKFPERSVNVELQAWRHSSGGKQTVYSISILPGLDGARCQIIKFVDPISLCEWVKTITSDSTSDFVQRTVVRLNAEESKAGIIDG